jgi:hypothetical protein
MSCGTGFTCGIHRFDKYKFSQHDKPANKELHNENEKRLSDLMQLREQQDKGIFQSVTTQSVTAQPITDITSKPDTVLLHQDHGSILYYSLSDTKIKKD